MDCEHAHAGFEVLIVSEVPLDRLWLFLDDLRASGDNGNFTIPARPCNGSWSAGDGEAGQRSGSREAVASLGVGGSDRQGAESEVRSGSAVRYG